MKSCFFIGHREAGGDVFPALSEAVEHHITEYGVTDFYVGHYGGFDGLAAQAVKEARERHPGIRLTLVLPYHPAIRPINTPKGFDGTFYPWEEERIPKRLAIIKTNQRMVDTCDYLITYAYATMKPTTNTKPFNTCVQFKGQRVFSLDGYRMACDTQEGVTFPVPFLCYGSSLAYLKVFGKSEVTVQVGTRWVLFTDGEASLCVRRQGVDTFDVDAALPRQYQETVTVRTAEFIRELNYLKECASGFTKPYVRFTGNQLTMAVPGGKFRTGIQVSGRGSLSLGFDLRYMLDALKQFKDAPEIRVKLSGIFSPIVIEAEGRDDFALVLPVRLKEEMAA